MLLGQCTCISIMVLIFDLENSFRLSWSRTIWSWTIRRGQNLQKKQGWPLPNLGPQRTEFLNKMWSLNFCPSSWSWGFGNLTFLKWSLKFLEICDLRAKLGPWNLKHAEMGVLLTARRAWKGSSGAHIPAPGFQVSAPSLLRNLQAHAWTTCRPTFPTVA